MVALSIVYCNGYATQVHINRLELKIDDLREMIWSLHHEPDTTKRNKKQ